MIASSKTYMGVLSQVLLIFVPVAVALAITGLLVGLRVNVLAGAVLLGLNLLVVAAVLRMLFANVIKVKPGHAVIVEDINTHQWIALFTGFHFCPPGLYQVLGTAANFAVEYERTIHNVTVRGGPALSFKITYTAHIAVPPGVLRLPRKNGGEHDLKYIIGLYIRTLDSAIWNQKHGVALEEALRHFYGERAQAQVYNLFGDVEIMPERLCKEMNRYLALTVERDKGYILRVCALEVLGMGNQGSMIWRDRMLQHLIDGLGHIQPEQALAIAEIFREVSGSGPHVHITPHGRG